MKINERIELKSKNRIQLVAIIEELLEEKKTWQNVCAFEKDRWILAAKALPYLVAVETEEHIKNLEKLAGENK